MKKVGLIITFNEYHFLKYSLSILLMVVDEVLILDKSNDGSREYLKTVNKVTVFKEEDYPEIIDFRSRRQFLLDAGRKCNGTHFVTIDADEVLSVELIDYLNNNDWNDAIYCGWYHVYGDLKHARNNYINETQGVAWIDTGIDYHGRDLVHEDKIPIARNENYKMIPQCMFHFGTCNKRYTDLKCHIYRCHEMIEGSNVMEINLRYLNEMSVYLDIPYTLPDSIDADIMDLTHIENKFFERLCNIVKDNIENNQTKIYLLDIWRLDGLEEWCEINVKGFNRRKIVFTKNTGDFYLKLYFAYNQVIFLMKRHDYKRIINFVTWKTIKRCIFT